LLNIFADEDVGAPIFYFPVQQFPAVAAEVQTV
jgi:hypothetical protein